MKKSNLLIIALCFLIGCQGNKHEFKSFTSSIQNISLPFIITCGPQLHSLSIIPEKSRKYAPIKYDQAAKFKTERNFQVLLFSSTVQSIDSKLYSFNIEGEPIDSLQLSKCLSTAKVMHNRYVSIESDLAITITDTIKHFSNMQHGFEYIQNIDSVIQEIRIVTIDKNGKFETRKTTNAN